MSNTFLPTLAEALESRYSGKTWDEQKADFNTELNIFVRPVSIRIGPTGNYSWTISSVINDFCEYYRFSEIGQYPLDRWMWNLTRAFNKTALHYWKRIESISFLFPSSGVQTLANVLDESNKTDNLTKSGTKTKTFGGSDTNTFTLNNVKNTSKETRDLTDTDDKSEIESDTPKNMTLSGVSEMSYASKAKAQITTYTNTGTNTIEDTHQGGSETVTDFGKTETESYSSYRDSHIITGYENIDKYETIEKYGEIVRNIEYEWFDDEVIKRCFMGVIENAYC